MHFVSTAHHNFFFLHLHTNEKLKIAEIFYKFIIMSAMIINGHNSTFKLSMVLNSR